MKLLEREEPLDPQAERELDALDRALAGRSVDADLRDWEELAMLLAEERPEPEPEWAEGLDRRARARFHGDGYASPRGLLDWLGGIRPMRLLAPAGALATLVVVAVVAASTLGGGDGTSGDSSLQATTSEEAGGAATMAEEDAGQAAGLPGGTVAPTAGGDSAQELQGALERSGARRDDLGLRAAAGSAPPPTLDSNGRIAPGTERRRIERDVRLSLSTKPDEVRDVSDEVISITRSLDGIVASSQVSEGDRNSSATLELTIPTRNLDAAIDRLTDLANVESLDEATVDVTKPFVSAQDRLQDAEAQREQLLRALGNATTEAEAAALQQRIDDARREISRAESAFENIARRARLSDLSVTVVGDPTAKDDRSLGDWLGDAEGVLRDVVGVLLVTAAIVIPLGLLIALAWLAASWARRTRRERALDA